MRQEEQKRQLLRSYKNKTKTPIIRSLALKIVSIRRAQAAYPRRHHTERQIINISIDKKNQDSAIRHLKKESKLHIKTLKELQISFFNDLIIIKFCENQVAKG